MSASVPMAPPPPVTVTVREPFPDPVPGLRFAPAAPGLWRVAAADGAVLGHIERRRDGDGDRFAARRLLPGGVRSMPLGEFWTSRDAAEVFR